MKKTLVMITLALSFFSTLAVVQPSTVNASEVTTTSAPSTEVFEIHRPYESGLDRIWHGEYKNGAYYSGYLTFLRSYTSSNGVMSVYRGRLRKGHHLPARIEEDL